MHRSSLFAISAFLYIAVFTCPSYSQTELGIWEEFIHALKSDALAADRIRPYEQLGDAFTPVLLGYLDSLRVQAAPEDWTSEPEVVRIGNRIQYIVPWTSRERKVPYCFSFITVDSAWYFQHLEAVFIRLDKIPPPPTSDFPDVSDAKKAWAREEIHWSFIVSNVYLPIAAEKGKKKARDMLRDGKGYYLGAKSWVPFVPPWKAFILYLCWEQSKLRGNDVRLEKLDDSAAVVRLDSHFFALYRVTAHLKPKISIDDYKQIFETIWQDRAFHAGWRLDVQYSPENRVTFRFTR